MQKLLLQLLGDRGNHHQQQQQARKVQPQQQAWQQVQQLQQEPRAYQGGLGGCLQGRQVLQLWQLELAT